MVYFLCLGVFQRYPSLSLQEKTKDWADVELDTTLSFGVMRETITTMIEQMQQELEKLASIGRSYTNFMAANVKS